MSNGKLDISSHLNEHTYPKLLLNNPKLIHLVYWWNNLLLQRNWITKKHIVSVLKQIESGQVLDAGCGEGLHLFVHASKFPNLLFYGVDKNKNHHLFCKKYINKKGLKNTSIIQHDLENKLPITNLELIWNIGTLQYIEDDKTVLANFFKALKWNGKLIIYAPINGKIILAAYNNYFSQFEHYEKSQKRKRIYTKEELINKLENAGFFIESMHFTYGKLGILAHESYSLLLMGIGSKKWYSIIFGALLAILISFIFILNKIDYLIPKNTGNGILIIAKKI